jgi:hypothetical protein
VSCAICETRKEKRFCPALHQRICPQCCGEQREVSLDCPSECVYLQQARQYEKPRPLAALDQSALFPAVEVGDRFLYEGSVLIASLMLALAKSVRSDRNIVDLDLIGAVTALAKSYDTRVNSGLYYEPPLTSVPPQAIAAEIQASLKEYRDAEQARLGASSLRDSDILKGLVVLLRIAYSRTSGRPKSRSFVDFVLEQWSEKPTANAGEVPSGLIVP